MRVQSGASHAMSNLNKKTWDPFRPRITHTYRRFQSGASPPKFNRTDKGVNLNDTALTHKRIGAGFTQALSKFGHGLGSTRNRLAPKYNRFQEGIRKAISPFRRRRKRKQNALGKVVGFATQEITEPSANVS